MLNSAVGSFSNFILWTDREEGGRYSSFHKLMLFLTEAQCLSTCIEENLVLSGKNYMKWKTQSLTSSSRSFGERISGHIHS